MRVADVSHDPTWRRQFVAETERIRRALGQNVLAVHRIGSTSIPDILAKPIVDILVEVSRIERVEDHEGRMGHLGYEACGEYGILGRRYFRKTGPDGRRAFHVHAVEAGSQHAREHNALRDYLLARPDIAREYSALKARLTAGTGSSSVDYQQAKAPFIKTTVADAVAWSRGRNRRHEPRDNPGPVDLR